MHANASRDPERLLAEARQGSEEALGALLEGCRNYLRLLARTQIDLHLQGRVSPSDVVQETCLRACAHFDQFRGSTEKEWLGWLRRILVHTLIHFVEKHLQAEKRDARRAVSLDILMERLDQTASRFDEALVHPGSSPSRVAERRELAAVIADHLAALPDDYREVIVLRHVHGLPFEEVAARMERSAGAVRMLWLRALEKLRIMSGEE